MQTNPEGLANMTQRRTVELKDISGQTQVKVTIELTSNIQRELCSLNKGTAREAVNSELKDNCSTIETDLNFDDSSKNDIVALMCLEPDAVNSTIFWQAGLTEEQIEAVSILNNKVSYQSMTLPSRDASQPEITVTTDDFFCWLTDPLYHEMSPEMAAQKEKIMESVPHLRGILKNKSGFGDWDGKGVSRFFLFCWD